MSENIPSFESSFKRLEEILDKLNAGTLPLEESLQLYEEADTLIISCASRLTQAEQRIETLKKNRDAQLLLTPEGVPETENFQSETS